MASASLNKMTVPLASDQSATSQGLLMPKLKYRFRVMFENLGISNNIRNPFASNSIFSDVAIASNLIF